MVHGYHIVMGMHGFWLPNDPRGSWSEMVRKWELVRFGETTRHLERRTLDQLSSDELAHREAVRRALRHPPVILSDIQIQTIATGFQRQIDVSQYPIWACSILPEHTHLVIGRHRYAAEQMAILLKGAATREVMAKNCHPLARYTRPHRRPPAMWAEHQWVTFLDSEQAIEDAINYVIENPLKEGRSEQIWPFVQQFSGIRQGGWLTYLV